MNLTLTIGRIGGVRIGINWSWLIVFGLIVWTLGSTVFPTQNPGLGSATYAAMAVAATLLFFARTGGARLLAVYPKRRMSGLTVHRWWYRHASAAGLVGEGMTSGLNMHRARHTFATELRRVAGLGAASQALGHSDLSTTASIYGHDLSDLERAMEALARSRREDQEPPD
jgi:Phage integrase family